MNQEYIEWEEEPIIQPTSDLKRLGCCSSQDLADGREEADDEEALAQLEVDWRSHRGHINESKADAELLFEMHRHIDEIEEQITFFHNSVSVFVCCR